ncbi:hypothetical protein [Methylocystis sp. Sn-Cys]|uniref:hypothetical protein n=1 Tax=Methylocystis sp. Sn-Cys TaxID=1701263 RepID=UPI0019209274|nr:hypothetical protein [Methylocystis sp. Sn-Cys]MBL1255460.1 hypothetical protein [Methylocystis sp. Sn-Cys]
MSLDYISEKLTNAVLVLATSTESLQKRLEFAALCAHTISGPPHSEEGFPTDELKRRFIEWWRALTAKQAHGDEGTLAATARSLTDDEARRFAEELFNIYTEVEVHYVRLRRLHD